MMGISVFWKIISSIFSCLDTCTKDQYRCVVSPQCIPQKMTCDMRDQCADGSDETLAAQCGMFLTPVHTRRQSDVVIGT